MRRETLSYAFLVIVLLLGLIPLLLLLQIAFADPAAFVNGDRLSFSWQNLRDVVASGNLWAPLAKSLRVAIGTAVLSVVIAAPGAYVLARLPQRLGYLFLLLIFFARMIPEVGIALAIALNFLVLGLMDTDIGLILAHLVRALPLVTWILIGSFRAIPRDLEQAGLMDGATKWQVWTRVVLPLAKPGLAVATIFGFLSSWDEFTFATYLSLRNKTLPLMVYYYAERVGWFQASTYAVLVTLPVVIFTYYFQRYLRSGYLSGAVRG